MTAILNPTGPAPLIAPPRRPAGGADTAPGMAPAAGRGSPSVAVGQVLTVPGARPVSVLPVTDGDRAVGAYVVTDGQVRYEPVVDVGRLVATAAGVIGAAALAAAVASATRRRPAIGAVTMGPGGWVSLRGMPAPALRSTGSARSARRRPWWAHLLRAHRLVVDR